LVVGATTDEYRELAELRTALRRFTRHSERLARERGLTPRQYLVLLMIKGAADGSERSTVTELSGRLQLTQSTVTELVRRAEKAGLILREASPDDARVTYLRAAPEGERRLAAVVAGLNDERGRLRELLAQTRRHVDAGSPASSSRRKREK
jgi:DNA-binding MarR family transcriptional regulator